MLLPGKDPLGKQRCARHWKSWCRAKTADWEGSLSTLYPQRRPESPCRIVRFRSVVVQEHRVEAAITKKSATELSDVRRSLDPARSFHIDWTKFLQFAILFFR